MIVAEIPTPDLIIGRDFLRSQECTIEMGGKTSTLHVKSRGLHLPISNEYPPPLVANINVVLSEPMEVMGSVPEAATSKTWVVQGKQGRSGVVGFRSQRVISQSSTPGPLSLPYPYALGGGYK